MTAAKESVAALAAARCDVCLVAFAVEDGAKVTMTQAFFADSGAHQFIRIQRQQQQRSAGMQRHHRGMDLCCRSLVQQRCAFDGTN